MFDGCGSLEQLDLRSFNTSNVTDMEGMLSQCFKLKSVDVSSFNT
jgi:surface protein